jgi:hypothetical protein
MPITMIAPRGKEVGKAYEFSGVEYFTYFNPDAGRREIVVDTEAEARALEEGEGWTRKHDGITLLAPADAAIFKRFTLNSGEEVRPTFHHVGIEATVQSEASARELERDGWRRQNMRSIIR